MAVDIKTVGVIGAGQMGNGIAHVCSRAGYSVVLNDVSPDRVKAGMATINGNMTRQVSKKTITEDERKAALALIKGADSYEGLAHCDLVIETARVPMASGFGVVGRIDGGAFAVTAGRVEPWGLSEVSPAMLVGSPNQSLLDLPRTLRAMPLEDE